MSWTLFTAKLPSVKDCSDGRHVVAKGPNGPERCVEWNWIPPQNPQAAELWNSNGFLAWKPTKEHS